MFFIHDASCIEGEPFKYIVFLLLSGRFFFGTFIIYLNLYVQIGMRHVLIVGDVNVTTSVKASCMNSQLNILNVDRPFMSSASLT